MKIKKFSIIMCIKNGEKYIDDQIQSIINQDLCNWELLIIDDCSIDNSLKIAKEYQQDDSRISVKKNANTFGVKNNFLRNSLLQKGEWLLFCDQDDIWSFNKLSCLNSHIENNNGFNLFLHNGSYLISDNSQSFKGAFGEIVRNKQKVYKKIPNFKFLDLLLRNKVIGCFICVNREFFKSL